MAVWSDKVDFVDTVAAAHVNQLADGFSTANTYNFGGTTTLEQLAASHAAAGAHTNKISTGDIVDNTIDPLDLETKCLATRQATSPAALSKGRLHIDTSKNNTYCDSEGSWQAIIIGTANIHSDVAGDGLTGGGGAALAVIVDDATIEIAAGTIQVKDAGIGAGQLSTAVAGKGLTGGGGASLDVQVDEATLTIAKDTVKVKDAGIGTVQWDTNLLELADGSTTDLHDHGIRFCLWTDHSVSDGTDGDNAPDLPTYKKVADDTDTMRIFNLTHHLTANMGTLQCLLMAHNGGSVRPAYIRLTHSGHGTPDVETLSPGENKQVTLSLDLTDASPGPLSLLSLDCYYAATEAAATLTVGTITVWEYIDV